MAIAETEKRLSARLPGRELTPRRTLDAGPLPFSGPKRENLKLAGRERLGGHMKTLEVKGFGPAVPAMLDGRGLRLLVGLVLVPLMYFLVFGAWAAAGALIIGGGLAFCMAMAKMGTAFDLGKEAGINGGMPVIQFMFDTINSGLHLIGLSTPGWLAKLSALALADQTGGLITGFAMLAVGFFLVSLLRSFRIY